MTNVTTGVVRFSYLTIDQPRLGPNAKEGDKPKYSVMLLIPKSDKETRAALKAAEKEAYEEGVTSKWNGKRSQVESVIHDGDKPKKSGDSYGPECEGHWVMNVSAVRRPFLVDRNVRPMDPKDIKSGDYGRANITSFPYTGLSNGVTFGLEGLQFVRSGDPLGGGISPEKAFDAYADDDDEFDEDDDDEGLLS